MANVIVFGAEVNWWVSRAGTARTSPVSPDALSGSRPSRDPAARTARRRVWKPARSRIGRDIEPAWITSAGVPRLTASSQRARTSAR